MSSKTKVYFFFDNVKFDLKKRSKIREIVELIFIQENINLERLNYIFCTDEALRTINKQYLSHDYYTDIITFDLSKDKKNIEGEIYISVERVVDNAFEFKRSQSEEMARVIFHGALHLCGFRDKKKIDKTIMMAKEDFYLKNLDVPQKTVSP